MEPVPYEGALDLAPAQRVRAVEHHHRDAHLGAGAHHQAQRGDERVGPAAHVLDVVDHDVDAFEHLAGGLARVAVERMHGQAGALVPAGLDLAAGPDVAAHAVLWRVEGHELDVGRIVEDLDGGAELAVHPGGVGDQADALAFQAGEIAFPQDFDAGLDPGCGRGEGGYEEQRRRAKNVTNTVARQHTITTIKNPT